MAIKKNYLYTSALIGLGNIAWRYDGGQASVDKPGLTHASVYNRHPQVELRIALSPDSTERQIAESQLGLRVTDSLDELLSTRPDIVSICSPSDWHAEHLRACLAARIPMIWLEKPAATSLADLDSALAANLGSTVAVNFQRRYQIPYIAMRDLCVTRELGRCRHLLASYSRGLETNGSHMVDQILFLAGDPVQPDLEWVSSGGSQDCPSFNLAFEDGLTASVVGLDLPYHCIDITAVFDDGRVSILHGGMTAVLERRVEHELFPGFYRLRPEQDSRFPAVCDIGDCMTAALNDLITAHESGRTPQSALASARVGIALMEAVRQRQQGVGSR